MLPMFDISIGDVVNDNVAGSVGDVGLLLPQAMARSAVTIVTVASG
jgi:hypothetical protein